MHYVALRHVPSHLSHRTTLEHGVQHCSTMLLRSFTGYCIELPRTAPHFTALHHTTAHCCTAVGGRACGAGGRAVHCTKAARNEGFFTDLI